MPDAQAILEAVDKAADRLDEEWVENEATRIQMPVDEFLKRVVAEIKARLG